MTKVAKLLENRNIKPSITRVKIMEYLIRHATHPPVEEIYTNLAKEIPTLSKTTVYNALDLFVNSGLARAINVGENESRYDANVSDHGHFKCNRCGRVYDFSINLEALEEKGLEGFEIMDRNVYFRGVCPSCRSVF